MIFASEAKQEELGCSMRQVDLGGNVSPANYLHRNVQMDMAAENGNCSSTHSHTDVDLASPTNYPHRNVHMDMAAENGHYSSRRSHSDMVRQVDLRGNASPSDYIHQNVLTDMDAQNGKHSSTHSHTDMVRQADSGGSASPTNYIHQNVHMDIDAQNGNLSSTKSHTGMVRQVDLGGGASPTHQNVHMHMDAENGNYSSTQSDTDMVRQVDLRGSTSPTNYIHENVHMDMDAQIGNYSSTQAHTDMVRQVDLGGSASPTHQNVHMHMDAEVRQVNLRGSASPTNSIHQNVHDAGNGNYSSTHSYTDIVEEPEETRKSNAWEERSMNCSNKYSCGGQSTLASFGRVRGSLSSSKVIESRDAKEIASGKMLEVPGTGSHVMKRKATDEPQERVVRTGLRDKRHNNYGRLTAGKIGRKSENDTLMSFRDRLVLQKQADAMKRKALEPKRGLVQEEKNETKVSFTDVKSMPSLKASSLKLLTRDIAKKALLEAGFRIDLRQRRSRDYQDAVYVSPDGHAYWSLPKAWDALKKLQAEKPVHNNGQGSSEDFSHEKVATSSMIGDEKLAKADKNALKQVLSRFRNDDRLHSALTKRGTCSGTNLEMAQDATRQTDLTNADLTEILLEDLGVLRRFTRKFLRKNRHNKSTDSIAPRLTEADILEEKRGMKRKRDNATVNGKDSASKAHQGGGLFKSREVKKQGTIRSLKQTMVETKTSSMKHKAKKGEKPKARSGLRLEVRRSNSSGSDEPACHSTRTVFAWMLDRGAVLEREKIFFVDQVNHQVVKEGVVTREGILCSCCKRFFTVHSFEAHAGCNFGDWHQALVFTSGKRLLDCQLKAWDAEIHLRKAHNYVGISEDDPNDDSCLLCGDGGDLLCCDGCPSTFHASCLQIDNVPDGDWYCPKCICGTCGGRQRGEEKEDSAVIVCNQCEHRYHISCLHDCHSFIGKEVFCRPSCEWIFSSLRGLIGVSHSLPGGFSWSLLRCMEEDKITGLTKSTMQIDCHSKLAVALLVIKECFNPMVDPRTNVDMITHAMYNWWSEFNRLNYAGFYTAVLEKEGEIISVASIRIHGVRLAEMPLIGTREKYRRQGMCRLLVGIIENLLRSLKVAFFILPAIPELFDTWTNAFGFKPLDSFLKSTIKDISMMVFPGTELLQKPVSFFPVRDASLLEDQPAEL